MDSLFPGITIGFVLGVLFTAGFEWWFLFYEN
jgi:hypothetical protein